jgi:putative hydrolase of the HAD superfamily
MLVLFDLDNTLMDHDAAFAAGTRALFSSGVCTAPYEEFVERWNSAHRRNFDRYLSGRMTYDQQRRARVRETLDASLSDAEADRLFDLYLDAYEGNWRLFDDVLPCLDALAAHNLGVVTNGQGRQQRRKLERLGIAARFAVVAVSTEVGWAKPDERIFRHARTAFGGGAAIHVGDSYELDALAARRAGLSGVWLDRRGEAAAEHAAPIVGSLAEIVRLVDALGGG